jgi:hypothetical protein
MLTVGHQRNEKWQEDHDKFLLDNRNGSLT